MGDKKLVIEQQKYTGESVVVSMRIPKDMVKALDDVAAKTGRTRNEIVTLSLVFALENLEIQ